MDDNVCTYTSITCVCVYIYIYIYVSNDWVYNFRLHIDLTCLGAFLSQLAWAVQVFLGTLSAESIWVIYPCANRTSDQRSEQSFNELWIPRERIHIPPNGKRKIIFKSALVGDMLVPWSVTIPQPKQKQWKKHGHSYHPKKLLDWIPEIHVETFAHPDAV